VIRMSTNDRPSDHSASGAGGVDSTPSPLPCPETFADDVVLRSYAGPGDLPGMTAAGNAWRASNGYLEFVTLDSTRVYYANLTNCDPATDCIVAERDGSLVGYARVQWADTRDGKRAYATILIVPPGPARVAVIDALFDRAEARATAIAAGHDTDRPRILDAFAPGADADLIAAARRRGHAAVRWTFEMIRPDLEGIPEVPMPAGLEVRPVRPEHLRAIWEADVEAFRDHWGWVDESEGSWERFRADPLNDPTLWRIAWDGDAVAGQVRSYVDAETNAKTGRLIGWTEYISVRRPWRRRGLARALLADSLRAIRDRGMQEAALSVDAGNETGALALYESLGFAVHRTEIVFHRPLPGYEVDRPIEAVR